MKSVLYYFITIVFTFTYFVIFLLLFLLTVAFDRERVVMHYASIVWALGMFFLCPWWHFKVTGRENIQKGKAYVIVNNHQTMMDIPLMYVVPLTFKWVSKKEVYRIPIFGWVMRMHGDIAIERGAAGSAKKMIDQGIKRLAAGTSVIIFPEGTRTKDGRVHRFKEGAFALAKHAQVDVLPCAIDGNWDMMDGWKLRLPHTFTVHILPPITQADKSVQELTQAAHKSILEEHKKLSDRY